jgi:hypothetical protein
MGRTTSESGQSRHFDRLLDTSGLPRSTDINRPARLVRFVPIGDINCRDCDVRSLAEPEPNRQVFVKFKHLLRKAAARSAETICVIIGEIL